MSEDQGITQKKANSLQFTTLTSHYQVPPQLSALHQTLHKHTQVHSPVSSFPSRGSRVT